MVLNCDMTLNTKFPVGGPPPKWTPPSPKNWRQNTGNNAIFPDLGWSIWQGLNQGEIYKLSRFLSRFIKIIVYNL